MPTPAPTPAKKVPTTTPTTNQYKYSFPIEDASANKRVLDQFLELPFAVNVRDLLSIAPEFRKQFRESTTTRRVPVGETVSVNELIGRSPERLWEQYEETLNRTDEGTIAGHHSVPLRCIEATLAGKQVVTCVLDQGAEIIAIRKDIWQKLGVPVRTDYLMTMESANKSKDATLGVIENLRFDFGAGEMLLQVQVIEKATFEVLLGRPFYALTSCKTVDFINGDQNITISDPNSGKEIMIATRPWLKACPRCRKGVHCKMHAALQRDF